MKPFLRILLTSLILFLITMPAFAGTFYVRTDGNDANSGTVNSSSGAWKTIQKAANTVNPSDIVEVQGGAYNEQVTITRSGAVNQLITFKTNGTVTIDGQNTRQYCIKLDGADYVKINGFTIRNAKDNGILLDNTATYNVISNNTCYNNSASGMRLNNASNYNTISSNTCYSNGGTSAYGDRSCGIYLFNSSNYNTLDSNICRNNPSTGIWLEGSSSYCNIYNNKAYSNGYCGIIVVGGTNYNTVSYNLIYSNGAAGVDLSYSAHDNIFRNNTIYSNGASGIQSNNSGYSNYIRNNIIFNNGLTNLYAYGIKMETGCSAASTYNDVYNNGQGGVRNYFGLTAGTGDISLDPQFKSTDSSSPDFLKLKSIAGADLIDSPCIDAGDPADIPSAQSLPRIDMGAYDLYCAKGNLGLVSLWHLNENIGTKAYDFSSYRNDGAITGAVWTTGISNSALSFNGIGDNVSVNDSASLRITDKLTISAWTNFTQPTSQKGSSEYIVKKDSAFKLGSEYQSFPNDEFPQTRAGQSSTPAIDTTLAKYGSNSSKFIRTSIGCSSLIGRYIDLTGVTSITLHGYNKAQNVVKGTNSWEMLGFFGRWYDANKTQLAGCPDLGCWQGTFDWTLREGTLTVPAGAKYYRILCLGLEQCTGTGWWDDVRITDQNGNTLFYASFEHNEVWFKAYNPNTGWVGIPTTQTTGQFTHYAGKYDGQFLFIYQDGIEKSRLKYSSALNTSSANLLMGSGFAGTLDELKIYNRALMPQEISDDYALYRYAAYWKFNENAGMKAYDASSNENTGTVVNAAWTGNSLSGPNWTSLLGTDGDDAGIINNDVDVKAGYASNDNNNLYLRFDVYGNISRTGNWYIIYLDTDQNVATGFTYGWWSIGADYRIYVDQYNIGLQKFMGTSQTDDTWGWGGVAYNIKAIPIIYKQGTLECSVARADIGETATYDATNILFRAWPGDDSIPFYDVAPLAYSYLSCHVSGIMIDGNTSDWDREAAGSALSFDGIGSYLWVGENESLGISDKLTLSAWIKANNFNGDRNSIIAKDGAYWLYVNSQGKLVLEQAAAPYENICSNTNLSNDAIYNVAGVWDKAAGRKALYINGELDTMDVPENEFNASSYKLTIGAYGDGAGSYYFNGIIDEVKISNKALTSAEIAREYDSNMFLGCWRMDENSGGIAYDTSTNSNHGVIYGAARAEGLRNSALFFDGVENYVSIADSPKLNPITAITLEAWIKPAQYPAQAADIITKYNGGIVGSFLLSLLCDGTIGFSVETPWSYIISNGKVSLNTWHHIVATFDGTNKCIYIDGVLDKQNQGGGLCAHTTPILIGARYYYGQHIYHFKGKIDEVKMYDRALSAAEVSAAYQKTTASSPSIKITSPKNGSIFTVQPITVSGTVCSKTAASVAVNGVPSTVSDNIFTAAGVGLTLGQNTVTATVSDTFNNNSLDYITVVYDNTPPAAFTVTDDGLYTNSITRLHARWTQSSDPETGISEYQYSIGTSAGLTNVVPWTSVGLDTEVTRTGLSLSAGQAYYFNVKAGNGAGKETISYSNGIIPDITAPVITVTSHYNGQLVSSQPITVTGTVNDDSATVVVNGITAVVSAGVFTAEGIPLELGQNRITVTATDLAANQSSLQRTVVFDNTAPGLPAIIDDGDFTNRRTELHAGWLCFDSESGLAEYKYSIGTAPGLTDIAPWTSVGLNTEITHTGLALTTGQRYYFNVKAKNGIGLESINSSDGITVKDNDPPVITGIQPPSGHTQDNVNIAVSAQDIDIKDALSYQFSVDDVMVQPWQAGESFNWSTDSAAIGLHSVKAEVKDDMGGQTSQTTQVWLFRKPPALPD